MGAKALAMCRVGDTNDAMFESEYSFSQIFLGNTLLQSIKMLYLATCPFGLSALTARVRLAKAVYRGKVSNSPPMSSAKP